MTRLGRCDPARLEHEVGDEMGEDQPGEDEDRVGHQAVTVARASKRAHDVSEAGQRAQVGSIGRHRDRRPADPQPFGRLGPAEALDEDEPGDLALTFGQLGQERAEERRRAVEEHVGRADRR